MTHLPLPVEAERLALRQMEKGDAADLRRIVTLPEVGRMLFLFPPDWTEAGAEDFIARWRFASERPFRLAIADREGRFIGTVGVSDDEVPAVFYFLDPAFARMGYASEAMAAFVALVGRHLKLPAVRAEVFTDNPASARILEKLGFVISGMGMAASAARLEPAPVVHYRLTISKPESLTQ